MPRPVITLDWNPGLNFDLPDDGTIFLYNDDLPDEVFVEGHVSPTEKWEPRLFERRIGCLFDRVSYEGELCTCKPTCEIACKGGCGCQACQMGYGDFLSSE